MTMTMMLCGEIGLSASFRTRKQATVF